MASGAPAPRARSISNRTLVPPPSPRSKTMSALPRSLARWARFSRPSPRGLAGSKPTPSSTNVTASLPSGRRSKRTVTERACECLMTLLVSSRKMDVTWRATAPGTGIL
jgi:hypothetical protein